MKIFKVTMLIFLSMCIWGMGTGLQEFIFSIEKDSRVMIYGFGVGCIGLMPLQAAINIAFDAQ